MQNEEKKIKTKKKGRVYITTAPNKKGVQQVNENRK